MARIAIVYYSTYGTNYKMASVAADAAADAGAEVRLRKVRETAPSEVIAGVAAWAATAAHTSHVQEVTPGDMEWANGYLFSAPTRYGTVASQMRAFIDTLGPMWQAGKLSNKVASAMTSSKNPHGGQEVTLLGLYATFMHWGSVVITPGYTDPSVYRSGGNPYGTSVTAGGDGLSDVLVASIKYQTQRVVKYANLLAST